MTPHAGLAALLVVALPCTARSQVRPHPPDAPAEVARLRDSLGSSDFGAVIRHFERRTRRDSLDAGAWYSLGLARLGRMKYRQNEPLNLGTRVGFGELKNALSSFERAVTLDPELPGAASRMAETAEALRDTLSLKRALAALRRADGAARGADTAISLWRGRLEREYGSTDSAAAALRRYRQGGGSEALAALELARTGFAARPVGAVGAAEDDASYFTAAASDDAGVIAAIRSDLALVAPDSVLERYDWARGTARAELLRRFWLWRDHEELRASGERLREHYRRLNYVRRHFRLASSRRFYDPRDPYRAPAFEFDDRGMIYLRHGEPTQRLRPFVFALNPNESWRYARSDGDLFFHFTAGGTTRVGGDISDYHLVESVLDLKGDGRFAPRDMWLLSRDSLSPIYSCMLNCALFASARAMREERRMGSASIIVGTATDSYLRQYRRHLGAAGVAIAVGAAGDGALAHVVFGVPAADLAGDAAPTLRLRFSAYSPDGAIGARLDTSATFRAPAGTAAQRWLVGRIAVPALAGRWHYRVAIEYGDSAGVVLPSGVLEVPRTDRGDLAMSGLVMGTRGHALEWVPAPGDTAYFSPFASNSRDRPLDVYYEVYGARPGVEYRTELSLVRLRADGAVDPRRQVRLAFSERAPGPTLRYRRTLDLSRARPGTYRLQVGVTGPDGHTVARTTHFSLL